MQIAPLALLDSAMKFLVPALAALIEHRAVPGQPFAILEQANIRCDEVALR
jgi:hypothetical protein